MVRRGGGIWVPFAVKLRYNMALGVFGTERSEFSSEQAMVRASKLASMAAAVFVSTGVAMAGDRAHDSKARAAALGELQQAYPGVSAYEVAGHAQTVFGRAMATGNGPAEAAAAFVRDHAAVFGVPVTDLKPISRLPDQRRDLPLMYDAATGTYKFTLVYYSQERDGIAVHEAQLRLLVRNEPGYPVVLARSSLRDLGDFRPNAANKIAPADARAAVQARYPELTNFTAPREVIWAGENEDYVAPVLGLSIQGESAGAATPQKRSFVLDAASGQILHDENLIHHVDIVGNVSGYATQGTSADFCAPEVLTPLPYPRIRSLSDQVFGDIDGNFVFPTPDTIPVKIYSAVRGPWFVANNFQGAPTEFFGNVTPPGPATFQHNVGNSEFTRAEVNGYISANTVRDFILSVNPAYPWIGTQTEMPVWVNRNDGFCPGNAWYDGSSINFCAAGGGSPNTGFSTVVYHEYGHHLVQVGGSGQGQYGEGTSDTVGMLITDESGTGIGFFGSCSAPLRDANNTIQYPCVGGIHSCGRLMSGSVWSIRNELQALYPDTYRSILSHLTVNSIPLHDGDLITPQIAIDFLTLDDNDANLENGSPNYEPICAGFAAHNMDCPPRVLIRFEYPEGVPSFVAPPSGTAMRVNAMQSAFAPVSATGTMSYRINGGAYASIPMAELSPSEYEVTIPASNCGDIVEFFVTVDTSGGPVTDPLAGGAAPYRADVAQAHDVVEQEDFEAAPGWTVQGSAVTGHWGVAQPHSANGIGRPASDYDGSGMCYMTGGTVSETVTLGTTILLSPVFDLLPAASPRLGYARWFVNEISGNGGDDVLQIDVSGNGGQTWLPLETVGPGGPEVLGGWVRKDFLLSSILPGAASLQVRFSVSHGGIDVTTSAGIDAVSVYGVDCGFGKPAAASVPDNGLKNRYLTFVPGDAGVPVSYRVERLTASGSRVVAGWVGTPDSDGLARLVSMAPAPRTWPEPLVSVTGCAVAPDRQYLFTATQNFVEFSGGLAVATTPQPGEGRFWGDVVGLFDADTQQWLWPDGSVTGFDIIATLRAASNDSIAPPTSWVDVHPQTPDAVVNGSDVLQIVNAFRGLPYPFLDPANCP